MSNVEVAEEETARGAFLRFDIRHSAFDIRYFLNALTIRERDDKQEALCRPRRSSRHEVPYRDPARQVDRSLVSIRPEASGLLDRRLLLSWAVCPPTGGLRAEPALYSFSACAHAKAPAIGPSTIGVLLCPRKTRRKTRHPFGREDSPPDWEKNHP